MSGPVAERLEPLDSPEQLFLFFLFSRLKAQMHGAWMVRMSPSPKRNRHRGQGRVQAW